MFALHAEDVHKSFGGAKVLDGAWIDVPEGSTVGLIGPNGAGKSTFLTILTKFMRPDQGRILSRERDVTRHSPDRLARSGIVRTFQVPQEFGELTVLQNLLTAGQGQLGDGIWGALALVRRVDAQEKASTAKADALLEFLKLADMRDRAAKDLSGGQKKLLELGRALMTDPYLLLLDEPFAGVAPALVDTLIERLLDLKERRIAMLVVEHNMHAVNALCDTVFVMDRGRILTEGSPAAIVRDARVLAAYLGEAP